MKKLISVLIAIMCILSLSSCNTKVETSNPKGDNANKASSTESLLDEKEITYEAISLTKEQMLEDFDALWDTLEKNYPYFGILERIYDNYGLDAHYYNISREKYREKIEAIDVNDKHADIIFLSYIEEFLMDIAGGTAHLGVIGPNEFSYLDVYRNTENPWVEVIDDPQLVKQYEYYGVALEGWRSGDIAEDTTTKDTAGDEDVASSTDNLEMSILEDGKTAYIKIYSFADHFREEEVPRILEFYSTIYNFDNLIVDITENDGGNISYWMDALVSPNITKDLSMSNDFLIMNGEVAQRFYGSYYQNSTLGMEDIKNNPSYINLNVEDLESLSYARNLEFTVKANSNQKQFEGKIWILTSPNVYSASEKLANFSKRTGFATLVGQTTGGEGVGNDPILYSLPNSRLIVRFNVEYCINEDGSCNQEIGTSPDIETDTPLETCLEIIKNS